MSCPVILLSARFGLTPLAQYSHRKGARMATDWGRRDILVLDANNSGARAGKEKFVAPLPSDVRWISGWCILVPVHTHFYAPLLPSPLSHASIPYRLPPTYLWWLHETPIVAQRLLMRTRIQFPARPSPRLTNTACSSLFFTLVTCSRQLVQAY